MPAASGAPVTERDAATCRDQGHATWTVDGRPQGTCPRCGEVTEPEHRMPPGTIACVRWYLASLDRGEITTDAALTGIRAVTE